MGLVRRTPLLHGALGPSVGLKLENLQRTGSFKLRGAVRVVASLSAAERKGGVVSASAGNHGAGLALACQDAGVPLAVVVPEGAPEVKRAAIAAAGARIYQRGATYDQAEAAAREMAHQRKVRFVSAFDDEHVIEGNGSDLAREILEQAPAVARVVAPVGGGGLIGGLARVLAPRGVEVIGVQPEVNCAMYESLRGGRALTTYQGRPTLAEGCEGAVAELTFDLARRHVREIALVSEAAIRRAVAWLYRVAG
ncbi:MAG TPA: pyridoxal-phosphate dependent enzyme, partial [Kofleriaceae bacterium]|nr:pyridoxal-phosphate dependent enzyme [Kofleriaceae bacterium]